jgi:hypothetical protein
MTHFELVCTTSGHGISVGDDVTLNGDTLKITELEAPEPGFCGCIHLIDAAGKESTCEAEDAGAEWHYDGQPYRPNYAGPDADELDGREDFNSGRWTQADTDSMEAGPDLPMRNEAGEYL